MGLGIGVAHHRLAPAAARQRAHAEDGEEEVGHVLSQEDVRAWSGLGLGLGLGLGFG